MYSAPGLSGISHMDIVSHRQLGVRDRREFGRSLRREASFGDHAEWSRDAMAVHPLPLLEQENAARIPGLVPVRRARLAMSPFAFFCGSPGVMAADLATTPSSGLHVQLAGNAHLGSFRSHSLTERNAAGPVDDLDDFDQTLPGPWEWDVKRLATSFALAGQSVGLSPGKSRAVVERSVLSYQTAMLALSRMRVADVWKGAVEVDAVVAKLKTTRIRREACANQLRRRANRDRAALRKLSVDVDGTRCLRHEPTQLVPLRCLGNDLQDSVKQAVLEAFDAYRERLPDHVVMLLNRYCLLDVALQVSGIESVGTASFVLLLQGRNDKDPLFLQLKAVTRSVLEAHLPPSAYLDSGHRVVEGQLLLQTVPDAFLGYAGAQSRHSFYVRQLLDWGGTVPLYDLDRSDLILMAERRGVALARAHARAGDPLMLAGYLGKGPHFARAIRHFSERYAEQVRHDHRELVSRISAGELEAESLGANSAIARLGQ